MIINDKLRALIAQNPEAAQVIRDCWECLMESGQLELNPPKSLINFFKKDVDDWE